MKERRRVMKNINGENDYFSENKRRKWEVERVETENLTGNKGEAQRVWRKEDC